MRTGEKARGDPLGFHLRLPNRIFRGSLRKETVLSGYFYSRGLALVVALKIKFGQDPDPDEMRVLIVPSITDNRGNGAVLNKLMSTKFPSSAVLMELASFMKHRGMRAIVEWAPRECNREADMLANGDSSLFDPERRIPVSAGTSVWNVLPEALKVGRDAEDTFKHMKETHGLPNRSAKQRKRAAEHRLKLTTLGSGIGRERHPCISITLLCSPSVFVAYSAFLSSGRLVSFHFLLHYAFLWFPVIYLLFSFSFDTDLLRAFVYCSDYLLLALLLCFCFIRGLRVSFSVLSG